MMYPRTLTLSLARRTRFRSPVSAYLPSYNSTNRTSSLPSISALRTAVAASRGVRAYTVVADAAVPKKKKVWESADEAVADIKSGSMILSGGAFILRSFPFLIFGLIVDRFLGTRFWTLRNTRYVVHNIPKLTLAFGSGKSN
jgi:hypothetical protein